MLCILQRYTTPARLLLFGLGADELFGGYARHATAFSGVEAVKRVLRLLALELGMDGVAREKKRPVGFTIHSIRSPVVKRPVTWTYT